MTLGFVMIAHESLYRGAQVARFWAEQDCPVVIHVDARARDEEVAQMQAELKDLPNVRFIERIACEWGTWSLVQAAINGAEVMLAQNPSVQHVYLASGSCLPLRPVSELRQYLADRPDTDFIESVACADVPWAVDGLNEERFLFRFPFSYKRQRRLFDSYTRFQRRIKRRRKMPADMTPHLGSQWWCLTRATLEAIFNDPERDRIERFFKVVWIPDEAYFQTLSRRYARRIESRSLTLCKFDFQGKPHIFYDDHLRLLRQSDSFVVRKVWSRAQGLYDAFLRPPGTGGPQRGEPNLERLNRVFDRAHEKRTKGRPGLLMQSRFPRKHHENGLTAGPYTVLQGFDGVFPGFVDWLSERSGATVHGHLFAPDKAEFADGGSHFLGALSANAALRDYNPRSFLTNLIWSTRGAQQCFMHGPADSQKIAALWLDDPNARIFVISGGWMLPLFASGEPLETLRPKIAQLQRTELKHIRALHHNWVRAQVRVMTLSDFLRRPLPVLQNVLDTLAPQGAGTLEETPPLADLRGFPQFLQELKNGGILPVVTGNFPSALDPVSGYSLPRTGSSAAPRRAS